MWCVCRWLCSRPAGPFLYTWGLLRLCPRVSNPPHSCHVLLLLCYMPTVDKPLDACAFATQSGGVCGICVLPVCHRAPLLFSPEVSLCLFPYGGSTDVCRGTVSSAMCRNRLWGAGPALAEICFHLVQVSLCLIQWAHSNMPSYTVPPTSA